MIAYKKLCLFYQCTRKREQEEEEEEEEEKEERNPVPCLGAQCGFINAQSPSSMLQTSFSLELECRIQEMNAITPKSAMLFLSYSNTPISFHCSKDHHTSFLIRLSTMPFFNSSRILPLLKNLHLCRTFS